VRKYKEGNVLKNKFDLIAGQWDTPYRINRSKLISNKIREYADFTTGHKVLDYGCGTGLISFNLVKHVGNITFVDSSEEMLSAAKEKVKYVENKYVFVNDIFTDSLESGTYDCIYTSMVLHHIKDMRSLVIKFQQLLKRNGKLCIVDLTPDDGSFHSDEPDFDGHNGFNPEELSEFFCRYGFQEEKREVFFSDTREKNGRKIDYSLFIVKLKKI
jgi:ubiquinone/menaquinone biosynthesis C-methylase UbiE